jgi:trans-aconitate methyltransferase
MRTPPEYFEKLYQANADPWGFKSRWYEQRKHALTVACLPRQRYRSAFEPGCSLGALTELLAPRCDRLLAVDHVESVVATTRRHFAGSDHVRVEHRVVPEDWPEGPFDLLVLSEIGYYFDLTELAQLCDRAWLSLEAGATVVAVHWRGPTDYPITAAQVHDALDATPALQPVAHHVERQFVLDVWNFEP